MKKLTFLILIALFLYSCGSSPNPMLVKKIDDLFANKKSTTFTMNGAFVKAMPWAPGHWVLWGNTNGEEKSISKFIVIDKENDGWVIEIQNLTNKVETAIQYKIDGIDAAMKSGDVGDIELKWIKMKDEDGRVSMFDQSILSIAGGFYKKAFKNYVQDYTTITDGGSITVPAGTFNTAKYSSILVFGNSEYESDVWVSSEVPINGLVKSVLKGENSETILLDFGKSGAASVFK